MDSRIVWPTHARTGALGILFAGWCLVLAISGCCPTVETVVRVERDTVEVPTVFVESLPVYRDTSYAIWDSAFTTAYYMLYEQYKTDSSAMFGQRRKPLAQLLTYHGSKITDRGDSVNVTFYLTTRTFDIFVAPASVPVWREDTTSVITPPKSWWQTITDNIVLVVLSALFGVAVFIIVKLIAKF